MSQIQDILTMKQFSGSDMSLEEAELEDPIPPNKWIYHKDAPLKNVLNYILHEYEMFKNEDEMEEEDGT